MRFVKGSACHKHSRSRAQDQANRTFGLAGHVKGALLWNQFIVRLVRADPEPGNKITFQESHRAIMRADAHAVLRRLSWIDTLKLQAAVSRILFEEFIGFACQALSIRRQSCKECLKSLGAT